MDTWLDTETKALLQRSPPEKLAPPDTAIFGLVLLAVQEGRWERLAEAVERVRATTRDEAWKTLACPLPTLVKRGLSHEDALLGQFELVACDSISAFLVDEVIDNASRSYLSELYRDICRSPEFELVSVRIEDIPVDAMGSEFLNRFLGMTTAALPMELKFMRKKARIMEHWAAKIGGQIVVEAT